MSTIHNSPGTDYAYLHGGPAFSWGVIALPGYEIVRARFSRLLPLHEGFEAIAAHLRQRKRPLTALCAAELRSPQPFTLGGFGHFNAQYVDVLRRWGLVNDERINETLRTMGRSPADALPIPLLRRWQCRAAGPEVLLNRVDKEYVRLQR